jgi:purine-nucleoside phosphorylase
MTAATDNDNTIAQSAALLRQRIGARTPKLAVVLGSGWGPLADAVEGPVDIGYDELPAFPRLAVGGHAGRVRAGSLGGRDVLVLAGRKHPYETGEADGMKGAVRTLAALGVQALVLTNAAGSLVPTMRPGALMLITDHINLAARSPLVGESGDHRFVDMNGAYCPKLAATTRAVAARLGQPLHEGVYAGRDPHGACARWRRGRHEHRAGDDPRPPRRPARAGSFADDEHGRRHGR